MNQLPNWHGPAVQPAASRPAVGGDEPADALRESPFSEESEQQVQARTDPPAQRAPQPGERSAPGAVIGGRYTLRTAIGHGGMGTVWRASDTLLRRDVAVKEVLLPPGVAEGDKEQIYQRTLREARAAAALSHPSVVQVYDVVTEGGRPWIVMELLQSRSLAEMIIEDGPLAARAVAKIGIALIGALEVAHAAGVLHRDVKPANVLICSDGRCVLTDFGVARMPADAQLTTPGMVLGSPHFISPERAIGAKFGPPSDLFSLGVTLYTAVEGHPPFDKRDPFETMRAIVEEPPTTPMRAGPLTGVLYGLLEKDPARRWDTPSTRKVLRELLAGPLASVAAVHVTDPYAVVRPAPVSPRAATPIANGQIGGRAMLAPGESVSSAIRRRATEDPESDLEAPPNPTNAASGVDVATGAYPAPTDEPQSTSSCAPPSPSARPVSATPGGGLNPVSGPGSGRPADMSQVGIPGLPPQPPGVSGMPNGQPPGMTGYASQPGGMGHPGMGGGPFYGAQGGQAGLYGRNSGDGQRATVKIGQSGGGLMRTLRGFSRKGQIAVAAGLALLVLLAIIWIPSLFKSDTGPKIGTSPLPSATSPTPAFPVQEYRDDRGFVVNVPKEWTKSSGTGKSYVDFVDPSDSGRKVRLNIESAKGTPQAYLESAEKQFSKSASSCAAPYARINLTSAVTISGQPAAELEYTCGTDRHGVWRAAIINNKAYTFFLTVENARFAESKPIYDEMVRSYQLTGLTSSSPTA